MVLSHKIAAIERRYSALDMFFLKRKVAVHLVNSPSIIGCTRPAEGKRSAEILLSPVHPVLEKNPDGTEMSPEYRELVLLGVDTHEVLHQLYTDFDYLEKVLLQLEEKYQPIFLNIFNVVEDPRIERAAPNKFEGAMLTALIVSIKHFYESAPTLEVLCGGKEDDVLLQIINALIMLGDRGPVKGHFLNTKAELLFNEIEPLFWEGVNTDNGQEAVDIALKIFNILRPSIDEVMPDMSKVRNRSTPGRGSGSGSPLPQGTPKAKSKKTESKSDSGTGVPDVAKTEKDESKEEESKGVDNSSVSKGENCDAEEGSADNTDCGEMQESDSNGTTGTTETEGDDSSDDQTEGGIEDEPEEREETECFEEKTETKEFGEPEEESEDFVGDTGNEDVRADMSSDESDNTMETEDETDGSDPKECSGDIVSEDDGSDMPEATDEDISSAISSLGKDLEAEERKIEDEISAEDASADIEPDSAELMHVSPELCDEAVYLEYVRENRILIESLSKQMCQIFRGDTGRKQYSKNGKISVKRLTDGRLHETIMQNRKAPRDLSDMCIELLVDESGSMTSSVDACKSRYDVARDMAIVLYEVFSRFEIPMKITGYTTSYSKCSEVALSRNYIAWHKQPGDRTRLCNIDGLDNNDDAVNIFEAVRDLKKRHEKHKLLLIVSDGQPYAERASERVLIQDVQRAVEEAAKNSITVLSVIIQPNDMSVFSFMYGQNYIAVHDMATFKAQFAAALKKTIRHWT